MYTETLKWQEGSFVPRVLSLFQERKYPGRSWSRGFALLPRFWAIKQFIILLFRCSATEINIF